MEGYLESLPQYFILTTIAITKGGLFNCNMKDVRMIDVNEIDYSEITCGTAEVNRTFPMSDVSFYKVFGNSTVFGPFHVPQYYWFRFTYLITCMSCSLGILRFLDVGPTRILERDGWRNYIGYGLAFITVMWSLNVKALGLGTGGYVMHMLIDMFNLG